MNTFSLSRKSPFKTIFKYGLLFFAFGLFSQAQAIDKTIVFIHTNDTHSQIEAISKNASKNADMGGVLRRKAFIDSVRVAEKNVILVDAGDYVQGTPYFNFFKGKAEIDLMNKMGYEIATLGNHEFDNGVEALAQMLTPAKFDIVSANYNVNNTPLNTLVKPYMIKEIDGVKIGIIGLCVDPKGLIDSKNCEGIIYKDPIKTANELAANLKKSGVDLIVILSHLGLETTPGDKELAAASKDIDIIIGGHSHTLLSEAIKVKNLSGKDVLIGQTGKSGLNIGLIKVKLKK